MKKRLASTMSPSARRAFRKMVYAHLRAKGRSFPWRETTNPYRILVSEVMLQQTQAERVIPKYSAFIRRFPTVRALARAPLHEVLRLWQGLGYNRRARLLHECAKVIVQQKRFPDTASALLALPGIGRYSAGAILAFAFNRATPIIETNIRTVYLHHFFKNRQRVSDTEIYTVVEATLDQKNPRKWYAALMDYGAYIKKAHGNVNTKSVHYKKQSPFSGSKREVRGAVVRILSQSDTPLPARVLARISQMEYERVLDVLEDLVKEGLLMQERNGYALAAGDYFVSLRSSANTIPGSMRSARKKKALLSST